MAEQALAPPLMPSAMVAKEQAKLLASELASDAADADAMCQECMGDFLEDEDSLTLDAMLTLLNRLQRSLQQMGWKADMISSTLGGIQVRGGAEEWLLPQAFGDLGRRSAANEPDDPAPSVISQPRTGSDR